MQTAETQTKMRTKTQTKRQIEVESRQKQLEEIKQTKLKDQTNFARSKKFSTENSDIYLGDCFEILKNIGDDSVDLIITSPRYADQRKDTYGGIHPDKYVEWFLPRAKQFKRVLKPTGFFYSKYKRTSIKWRKTYLCFGADIRNAKTRLALDRVIYLA